ncbi:hypothetical protein [Actinomadura sp. DC4]|uniref:hypothetical protein n=1 Tax=Actinomadura sp. DC4 TaxID=3055069 RepID=UPI0025B16F29|nr:hypothetical protein [Actinomadura sp. DC4]MDN3360049.1 hypothetical protein [Actinomadura sp. DC4]
MSRSPNAEIPFLDSREEYFNRFDGIVEEGVYDQEKRRLPGGLLKSYLLETVGDASSVDAFERIMARSNLGVTPVRNDEQLYRVTDPERHGVGLIERVSDRYLAFYTLLPADKSDSLIGRAVNANPMLDHLWLSSQSFNALWRHIRNTNDGRRYGKITFEHESLYAYADDEDDLQNFEDERRASRFTMVDKLEVIEAQMGPLRDTYAPLASITHLRIPAASHGGHDLYHYGKMTNRSDSFLDHRAALLNVVDMYSRLTETVEKELWASGSSSAEEGFVLHGAVAELIFSQPLGEATFRRWVVSLFNNRRNRFRISGFPTWLSERKVHANAIDQHLWQPIILELTPERVVAVLPKGTCGNSINRLVTNIQRFVDPNVRAYIGDNDYSNLIPQIGSKKVG